MNSLIGQGRRHWGTRLKSVALSALCFCGSVTPSLGMTKAAQHISEARPTIARKSLASVALYRTNGEAIYVKAMRSERPRGQRPATTTLIGVEARLKNSSRESLTVKADQIVIMGALDPARVDLTILAWLEQVRLVHGLEQAVGALPDSSNVRLEIKNLDVLKVHYPLETRIRLGEATVNGAAVQNGQVSFAAINGTNFSHEVRNLLLKEGDQKNNFLRIAHFSASDIDPTLFGFLRRLSQYDDQGPKFDQLKVGRVSFQDLLHWERGRSSAELPDVLSVARLDVDQLDRGTMRAFDVRQVSFETHRGPNFALSFARMSGRNWSNRPYVRIADYFKGRKARLPTEDAADLVFARLWQGGPLDIGIDQFELRNTKLTAGGFDVALNRFAIVTRRAASGLIERFEIPPGQLEVNLRDSLGSRMARDFVGLFELLKIDRFRVSWRVLATFDARKDVTRLEKLAVNFADFGRLDAAMTLHKLQDIRQKLIVIDLLDQLAPTILPNTEEATRARAARQLRLKDSLAAIEIGNIFLEVENFTGLERISQAWADRRQARRQQQGQTAREVRYAWAALVENRYRVSPLANAPKDMILFAAWVRGAKDWLISGGILTTAFTPDQPVALINLTRNNPKAVEAVSSKRHYRP